VLAYWGDRAAVDADWPALGQFNHCILAVPVGDDRTGTAVVAHPVLGRLLVFDPTDSATTLGDLDYDHQGSTVLVMGPAGGHLVELPRAAPEANRLDRIVEAELRADGALVALVTENSSGQEAARERRAYRQRDRDDYERLIRAWIGRTIPVAAVKSVDVADDPRAGTFHLQLGLDAPHYGRSMPGQLLVFKPVLVERRMALALGESDRRLPIVLDAQAFREEVRVALPEGFAVEELAAPVVLKTDFGEYTMTARLEHRLLHVERTLHWHGTEVPPDRLSEVRAFLDRIVKSEQTPVVLGRR
jgi:hypothetical protein